MSENTYDTDRAFSRVRQLWRRLGGLYEKAAYEHAKSGRPHAAMECGRFAEACFWQATGEQAALSMDDVCPKKADAKS